jgi:phosphorylase kinase alpha/beta subunit
MLDIFAFRGPDWDTQMEGRAGCRVRDLLVELYEKAGHAKQWWLVRHTAGMLRKKVEDLAKAATDIIVRMKQLAVGLPPEPREKIIIRYSSLCSFYQLSQQLLPEVFCLML